MKAATRFFCVIMVLAIVCGLFSACGSSDAPGESAAPTVDPNATVWVPSFTNMPKEIEYFNEACVADGYYYLTATAQRTLSVDIADPLNGGTSEIAVSESAGEEYVPVVYKVSLDGSSVETLPEYVPSTLPEGQKGGVNLNGVAVDGEGNIWVGENVYSYHYEAADGSVTDDEMNGEYIDDGSKNYLRKLSPTGAEILSVDLTEAAAGTEYFYVQNLVTDAKDNVYFTSDSGVFAYDSEGKPICSMNDADWINTLVRLSDGTVAAGVYEQQGFVLKAIDTDKKGWGKSYPLTDSGTIYAGNGDYLCLFNNYSSVLCGWDAEKGEAVELVNWLGSDIDVDSVKGVRLQEDGTILALCSSYGETSDNSIVVLTETPASQVTQKTTLTLACMGLGSNIRSQVLKFNRSSDEYRIDVKDYSQYSTEADYSAGLTKLNTEIMSGSVPDIIDISSLPVKQYAAKGLLTDLYPFIDADSELSREDLVAGIMKALEVDGHLYQASSDFGVMTVMGRKDVVGEGSGWTLEEMMDCYNSLPEGSMLFQKGITQTDMLQFMCYMNLDRFVNYETGECSFNSDGFIDVLRFCGQFPATYEYSEDESYTEALRSGKQMLQIDTVSDYHGVQMNEALFGGEIVYKGFPTESGSGSVAFVNSGLAIAESSKYKDAAWSFVRGFLTEDFQTLNVWSFPTNQKAFDAKREEAMKVEYDENGKEISTGGMGIDDFMIELYAITPEQDQRIQDLIASVDGVMNMDDSVFQILKTDAEAYFSGSKSAEDVAKAIQSKVNIYINEQR